MKAKIWYLFNSSFAFLIDNKLLVFDYYLDEVTDNNSKKCLNNGVINPDEIKDYEVYVFVSHRHYDHYNSVIFQWQRIVPDITYIISDDIEIQEADNIYLVHPHKEYSIKNIYVKTLKSNDEGVAFLIKINEYCLFFSGDLNWWYWSDESDKWNKNIEKVFKSELKTLEGEQIDYAFIPVDPRLEASYDLSLKYFIDNYASDSTYIVPMHFRHDYRIFEWLRRDGYYDKAFILEINKRGQLLFG